MKNKKRKTNKAAKTMFTLPQEPVCLFGTFYKPKKDEKGLSIAITEDADRIYKDVQATYAALDKAAKEEPTFIKTCFDRLDEYLTYVRYNKPKSTEVAIMIAATISWLTSRKHLKNDNWNGIVIKRGAALTPDESRKFHAIEAALPDPLLIRKDN